MRSLLWAIFLACSWCWCIGMFFPVLMVRDFGPLGWLVFLVPNCIGAMMVGIVHRRRGSAAETAYKHAPAARAFSIVTILFHASFLSWFVPGHVRFGSVPPWAMFVAVLAVISLALWAGLSWKKRKAWLTGGVCVFAASFIFAWAASRTGNTIHLPKDDGRFGTLALAAFAPVVALGFLTCPHLDLTFLRVCRERNRPPARAGGSQETHPRTSGASTLAFVLGFAVFFPALMVLTLLYAGALSKGLVSYYAVAHIAAQSWFTMAAHFREVLRPDTSSRPNPRELAPIVGTILLVSIASFLATSDAFPGLRRGLAGDASEYLYKSFIVFYGVIFPAYVWIVMVPRRDTSRSILSPRVLMWGAIGAAIPFAWIGYMREIWVFTLGIPAMILLAPLVGRLAHKSE